MSDTAVYLVTGANRGIGLSIVKALASNPANVIFAGARAPASATALHELANRSEATINVIELVSAVTESNHKAAEEIKKVAGRVDVIIANAGVGAAEAVQFVHESDPAQWTAHYKVNVIGPVVLYKEFYSLLRASNVAAKFIVVSSIAGSLELAPQFNKPFGIYSTSKAAVNYATIKIHLESEDFGLVAFPLHPGTVKTDMSDAVMEKFFPKGEENPFAKQIISPEESAEAILKVVNEATRESHGGKFLSYDGSNLPY